MTGVPDKDAPHAGAVAVTPSTLPFDICCTHVLPCDHGDAARCQLWAGHDGDHALMLARDGERVVRTWRSDKDSAAREQVDYRSLPWARGFPQPAWHEKHSPPDYAGQ